MEYRITYSRRRSLAIYVGARGEVEIRAPKQISRTAIARFVESKSRWIARQQEYQRARIELNPPLRDGVELQYEGEPLLLRVDPELYEGPAFDTRTLSVSESDRLDSVVAAWFRKQAGEKLPGYFAEVLEQYPLFSEKNPQLKIRKMRRRWGSCRSNGVVTLNSELIKLPKELIELVMVHELCHLFEMNHSAAFYRLLDSCVENRAEKDNRLDRYRISA